MYLAALVTGYSEGQDFRYNAQDQQINYAFL